jgi:hypothetical protein
MCPSAEASPGTSSSRQWFWALEAITEANPVPREAAGKVRRMARAWLEWGKQQGLIGS